MSETKPVAIKQGVPKEQHNGLFGMEDALMADPSGQVTAIVTYTVEEIVSKELAGERYPVLAIQHIEPLKTPAAITEALALREAAYKERVSSGQLDIDVDADQAD